MRYIFPLLAIVCLTPYVSSALALLIGILAALLFGNPYLEKTKKLTSHLLSLSVIGLGAGMNLKIVGEVGLRGISYTVLGITGVLTLGTLLGKIFKTDRNTSLLITIGTAICGGSAIAATAPVIQAKDHEVSVSLGIVFLLNALALFIFPFLGHHFFLSETQFGLWSALAIHDTSSVVGSTLQYGPLALKIGTTVKLARALWIVPVASGLSLLVHRSKESSLTKTKGKKPWFILGFLIMAALMTWLPSLQEVGHLIEKGAKQLLILTLFFIGSNLTRKTVKNVGIKPFIQGLFLWLITASVSLYAIYEGWISF